ncbi:DM13 domain-containing protein [Halobium salinum]|uniref:DM13 domain-containing protein n=1 Tax=Halobium salinum TaxID=1364940 RepID=A0ABD5P7X1_9EURY|nr:DM13 domain-containing protein [Halobium salinum]
MKRRQILAGVGAVTGLGVAGVVGWELFAPERSTMVAEAAGPTGMALKRGVFVGKANHRVSGTVTLYEDGEGVALRFEEYEQTQGPDVFVYLTPAPDPDTTSEVDAGVKILVDGGADGGESTKEGTFTQRLPAGVDPSEYMGVSIWCDRFAVPFGAATLTPV